MGLIDEITAVVDHQRKARINTGGKNDIRQHRSLFTMVMVSTFWRRVTIVASRAVAADNQNVFRMTVRQQRDVGHHFMINKLVAFRGLYHAVQRHHAPKAASFQR